MSENHLRRTFEAADGLFGLLRTARGETFATLELPWRDNRPQISCVPPGRYELVRYSSPAHPRCWALKGPGVAPVPGPGIVRSAVLIHPANFPSELRGCIAAGLSIITGKRAAIMLGDSARAVDAFFRELDSYPRDERHWLTIEGGAQ